MKSLQELLYIAESILTAVSKHRHQGQLDGMRNIWILKPGDKSLGRGIVLMDRLQDILNKINLTAREGMQYVVQKYIGIKYIPIRVLSMFQINRCVKLYQNPVHKNFKILSNSSSSIYI